jgi:hypothetical protein
MTELLSKDEASELDTINTIDGAIAAEGCEEGLC